MAALRNNKTVLLIICMMHLPFGLSGEPLEVGAEAPRATATTHEGKAIDLGVLFDQGPTLLFFYPRADTPGCTAQVCNLRDNFSELRSAGIQIIGVSSDSVDRQASFHDKYTLPFPLIADAERSLIAAFGVPTKLGAARRQSFLIVDGKVAWRDLSATPATQAADALAAFQALRKPADSSGDN